MARLSADYATLSEINPRLIYCSLSGFGTSGPYVKTPAHDMNYISLGGVLSLIGERGGYPVLPSNFIADIGGAALHGLVGILTALHARERTGRGQHVDISYLDSVVSLLALEAPAFFRTGQVPRRGETRLTGADPWTKVYKCADGEYITVACIEPHFWDNLCRLLGHEEFIKYQRSPQSQEELDTVSAEMAEIFATRGRDEWFEFFTGEDVCFGPVHYLDETFSDPQVLHRDMVAEKEHPRLGKVKQVGLPVKLSNTPARIESLGVPNGANTAEILGELGYADAEIDRLVESGAVTRWQSA
jgi:crotonobetainyl-CoA:carnitine CoA-transferase CaiB-like acyl-CoA transferase